jgi:hypothetical protein
MITMFKGEKTCVAAKDQVEIMKKAGWKIGSPEAVAAEESEEKPEEVEQASTAKKGK